MPENEGTKIVVNANELNNEVVIDKKNDEENTVDEGNNDRVFVDNDNESGAPDNSKSYVNSNKNEEKIKIPAGLLTEMGLGFLNGLLNAIVPGFALITNTLEAAGMFTILFKKFKIKTTGTEEGKELDELKEKLKSEVIDLDEAGKKDLANTLNTAKSFIGIGTKGGAAATNIPNETRGKGTVKVVVG